MEEIKSNGLENIISQALKEMKAEPGSRQVNLAELERRTGISRAKLRRLQRNGFVLKPHGLIGQKQSNTVLTGYTAYLDRLLGQGITNSVVCLERLQSMGYEGSLSTVKRYIQTHRELVPAKRQLVAPQAIVVKDLHLNQEMPIRWIGASPKSWTMMGLNTQWPVLR